MLSSRIAFCILLAAVYAIGAEDETLKRIVHARRHHGIRDHQRVHQNDRTLDEFLDNSKSPVVGLEPGDLAARLLPHAVIDDDPLYIMFTGDPQYHFPCVDENLECKKRSRDCRKDTRLNALSELMMGKKKITLARLAQDVISSADRCAVIESTFANHLQRRTMFALNRHLLNVSVALVGLVINGDLTNYGHPHQLQLFKDEWLSLPIPVFAGLGNHDYEINVDDCSNNQCANQMLKWFVDDYAPKLSLTLNYAGSNLLWQSRHQGSLAYTVDFCSRSGSNCVHSFQLNNRADYGRRIEALDALWDIRPSLGWLESKLESIDESSRPILINVHDNERNGTSAPRLNRVIEQWLKRPLNQNRIRPIMVLFAHWHNRHELYTECIANVRIPFVYVGSVPYNRYTVIKFSRDVAYVFLLRANVDATTTIMKLHEYRWKLC